MDQCIGLFLNIWIIYHLENSFTWNRVGQFDALISQYFRAALGQYLTLIFLLSETGLINLSFSIFQYFVLRLDKILFGNLLHLVIEFRFISVFRIG